MAVTIYSRYYGLETVTIDGERSLAQRPIPPLVDYTDSLLHVMKAGETLDQLAFVYYGREDLWWRIADANPTKFPLDWAPGDTVVIPPLRVATRTASR
jgi:nucleoid-associated protein YgaU